jgi:hypothetical protein
MRHPTDAVFRIQIERYRAMSAERKLELAARLRAFAWETKLDSLRRQHPDLSPDELLPRLHECFGTVRA